MAAGDYRLGIDLGTTFTSAAVMRDGRVEPVALGGSHGTAIPTVVYLAGDQMQVGVDAVRRSTTEPGSVVREFKRRVGDPTPLLVGGRPVAPEWLLARLVSWIVGQVSVTEGGPPQAVAVTHPANWGDHKRALLHQAIEREAVRLDRLVPEPVAAAHYYVAQRRLAPGSVVAVYDLGGGTFDAAVVEVDGSTCALRGRPDGIERLGGIDFDEAVFGHVLRALRLDPDTLDPEDLNTVAAVAGLRRSCVEAKEALSDATEVMIPVMLPDRHTEVRLTRPELEAMIRPPLDETVLALRRAIDGAGVTVDDLTAILLVGGSSRIPLVEQLVTADLGRPVATDARPKDAISMGAAFVAAQLEPAPTPSGRAGNAAPAPPPPPTPPGPAGWAPPPTSGPPSRRRRLVPLLVGLVLVVGAVAAGVVLQGDDSGDSSETDLADQTDEQGAAAPADEPAEDPAAAPAREDPAADRAIAGNYDLSGATVALGWLDTSDQFLLANITAQALEEAGATVRADGPALAIGAEALRDGLVNGDIDLFWDYEGRPAGIDDDDLPLGASAEEQQDRLNDLDAADGIVWLEPAGFTREYGLAMRRADAERLGISSIADIADLLDEDPAAASVCFVLEDALHGLESTYGFRFTTPVFVPYPDDVYPRLAAGDCLFGEVPYAIHPAMVESDLVVLEDNRSYYIPMNPAPRIRSEVLEAHPEIEELLASISQALDNRTMAELVARVEVDGELAADVANDWLQDSGFLGPR